MPRRWGRSLSVSGQKISEQKSLKTLLEPVSKRDRGYLPDYSITSSARSSRDDGTLIPTRLAASLKAGGRGSLLRPGVVEVF